MTSPHNPLAAKRDNIAEKLNRRRKDASETSIKINEQRSSFFDRLGLLNAGALTFSVSLLGRSNQIVHHVRILHTAWIFLLLGLVGCLARNFLHQGYHFSHAVASRAEAEVEYIDVDTEIISSVEPIIYMDSAEPFNRERELEINKNNREKWHTELQRTRRLVDGYWNSFRVSEWVAGAGMLVGFLLLIVFAMFNT
jgi:hypothetical protein